MFLLLYFALVSALQEGKRGNGDKKKITKLMNSKDGMLKTYKQLTSEVKDSLWKEMGVPENYIGSTEDISQVTKALFWHYAYAAMFGLTSS